MRMCGTHVTATVVPSVTCVWVCQSAGLLHPKSQGPTLISPFYSEISQRNV